MPDLEKIPEMKPTFRTDPEGFAPYMRDETTLARPWAVPGTPGLEHRIGGLEKQDVTGNVSYDAENHELMVRLRAAKVARIVQEIPPTEIHGDDKGDLLLIGWGSTRGAIYGATNKLRAAGKKVSSVHLRYLNPLPPDLGDIMQHFKRVVCPEINMGQLSMVLRAKTLVDVKSISKIQGLPYTESEIIGKVNAHLEGRDPGPFLITTIEKLGLIHFPRGTEQLPPETQEIQPHPKGIELGILLQMIKDFEAANK